MVSISNTVADPSVNFLTARAGISDNPFTAGQRFAQNNQRELDIQQLLQTMGGNNQLRIELAKRISMQEAQSKKFSDISGNIPGFIDLLGRDGVNQQLLNLNSTGFTSQADVTDIITRRGGALEKLAVAANQGLQGGEDITLDPGMLAALGASTQPAIPTSVQAEAAAAGIVEVDAPLLSGGGDIKFKVNRNDPVVANTLQTLDGGATGLRTGNRVADTLTALSGVGVIEADEPVQPTAQNTEAQINAVNKTVKQIRTATAFKGRRIAVRHGEGGVLIVMLLDPEQVIRVVDVTGSTTDE